VIEDIIMKWKLKHKDTGDILDQSHSSKVAANTHLSMMGESFAPLYDIVPDTNNKLEYRMLTEGLVAGDLRHIILPQISVDEYLPGDTKSDNIVIAFFVKSVAEAVIPFRDFILKCSGVLDAAYSDSDTQPNTSIVYVEMARKIKISNVSDIMEQVGMLTNLEVSDFSMVFPSSTKRYPYNIELLGRYFNQRTNKQNWEAQTKALNNEE
jgi:hypothetical protein